MREATLERRLSLAVKEAGGYCLKLPAMWYIGIPDRMLLLPGRVIFVELKTDKGRASPAQKNWESRLTKLRLTYYIIHGLDQLERFLDENVRVA
jgi:hypothetical protein